MAATSQNKAKYADYDGFVEKFKPKKTTDDCYTPEPVYEALLKWIDENITPLKGRNIIRPFWPGGDYEAFPYGPNDVVIDNPPFSILSKICKWYAEKNIKYFLFAPSLTLFSAPIPGEVFVVTHAEITYHNGAIVRTSFRTNLINEPKVRVSGDLYQVLKECQERVDKRKKTIKYPDNLITSSTLGRLCVRGIRLDFKSKDLHFVRKLDSGLAIFGSGFILSERAAVERAAAERAAAEEVVYSERELQIIERLNDEYRQ